MAEINYAVVPHPEFAPLSELGAHESLDCRNWLVRPFHEPEAFAVDVHEYRHLAQIETSFGHVLETRPLPLVGCAENSNRHTWHAIK